ncbi:hypothetical protein [Streptomyces reniochalinae]|uniref:Uncharacterized protein n=1 Tax=Streptomyces reniochalinae TaxID=2250578 RepID=A0A367EMD3_9ACTN|nr:hypothetical protein [Streptomyces reniochalinae]RCG19276.1 hypothetical protein DQ392_11420 [Streptomyces reniochalinae]
MSYPPPPGQSPHNPYSAPQQPQQGAPYGYPQQGAPAPYGYPQAGMPAYPGGGMQPAVSMPGVVVTARVLLFIAGSLWALFGVLLLIGGVAANDALDDIPGVGAAGGAALGIALFGLLIGGGLATLHIVPASMFGKGRSGTRVTAIIAGAVNALIPLLSFIGQLAGGDSAGGSLFLAVLWLATAVLTIVFCSMSAAGQWFNRPQY